MPDPATGQQPFRTFEILVVSPTPTHPQDHGNRKQIYEICSALKGHGARIHFVHYPAEHDWRHAWPAKHENEMRAAWDSYQLVAPSRPLHSDAIGRDHDIDEWADPDVENFIAWACRVRSYDMVIVNYTWMSFCLKAVPQDIFTVCDTHDVFGGRRQLLETNGLAPEFFHTTAEGEARGLSRADLVWAIKKSEQSYFENELQLPNCLTMLHAEPDRGWWTAPPSTDGYLRAGVIGARNNVNRRNLEDFLREAIPVFESYMAPVKIVIAGGCAEDFKDWVHPNVEILGRVAEVEEFYRGVDVVIAPMQFSTGLKIKVSEALASGAPLIAHAHATEGYPTREPLHLLGGFKEMALELAKLAFDPSPLPRLAARSRSVCAEIRKSVSKALEATRTQLAAKLARSICVVVPMEAFDPASLLHDHLIAALDYLRFTASLEIYVTGSASKAAKFDILQRFELRSRLFADPRLVEQLGEKTPEFFAPIDLAALLEVRGYERAYLMADCGDELAFATGRLRQALVRHDAIEMAGGDVNALIDLLRPTVDVIVIGSSPTPLLRLEGQAGIAAVVHAPFRRTGPFESFQRRAKKEKEPKALLILARASNPLAAELLALVRKLGLDGAIVDPADPSTAKALLGRPGPGRADGVNRVDPLAGFGDLRLLVDMTEANSLATVLGEAALRLNIPRLAFQRGALALSLHHFATALYPTSVARLFTTVAEAAVHAGAFEALHAEAAREATARFGADAGWTVLWRLLTQTGAAGSGTQGAAAELWG